MECNICPRGTEGSRDAAGMDVEVLKLLAVGSYGRVFQCRDLETGALVAMKQIRIMGTWQGVPAPSIREVSFLMELDHNNIVKLLKVGISDKRYVNLVFEHLDCDLHDYIQSSPFPRDALTIKSFMYQMLSAVEFCHSRKILHRDLKPKNVLMDQSRRLIKLADFGLARECRDDILYTEKLGTAWYRAPEILCDDQRYSTPVDVWAAGCIFAEMVTGQPLFQAINSRDELEAIFRLLGTPTEETWSGITELLPNLHLYPNFDPLGLEVLVLGLDRNGLNLLSRMLCMDPRKRISAAAALHHAYFKEVNLILGEKTN
ncbi:unnamed protein product [Sphenostylis stenocarpa]|uniref:Protein kinase domain-containing protein n=1 Tax=Sphenostylis stenocarpa TaxID=92480 RepID=A0AA87B863_9FABA|nr:unnamed protein product [Sphenostylis stenocarpa]